MIRRALAVTLSVSLMSASIPHAHAEAGAAELAVANKKFDRAIELEKAGDYKGALALLREVAAARSTSETRFHIAVCLAKLGRLVEAREEYLHAKEDAEVKEGPESAPLAKKSGAAAAELDERIPRIEVRVPEEVISAKLSIDGGAPVSVMVTPVVRVDPGEHKLQVTSPGKRTFSQTVKLKERDATLVIHPELAPADTEEPTVTTTPTVGAVTPPAPRRDETPQRSALPWVVGGFGLASLATAGIFYALRDSAIHDLDQACGPNRDRCPRSLESTEDRGRLYSTTANVFLGVGAAALVTGVVLYVSQPAAKAPIAAAMNASPTGLSLSLTGAF